MINFKGGVVDGPLKSSMHLMCLAFFVFLLTALMIPKALADDFGAGSVDLINQDGDKIVLQGWVGANNASQKISSISVWLSDKKIYEGPFERYERPDVVDATKMKTWLKSGWRLRFRLPDDISSGEYITKIIAKLDSGDEIKLAANDLSRSIKISGVTGEQRSFNKLVKIIVFSVLGFLVALFVYAEFIAKSLRYKLAVRVEAPTLFGVGIGFAFFVFLGFGLTGSSLGTGLQQSPFIHANMVSIAGQNQSIRSDEWLVLTPLAIAQFNHFPKNPIVNKSHGENGQNMLIVGMTGVPVSHLSALAKPATWGYFIFDLKRALAWNWLFPIFSCLIALWAVVSIIIPGHWRASFLVSLLFCSTPYVVAWSNWPAYAVFFPSLIFVCANFALRTSSLVKKMLLSILLGLAFAGFVFVLYPPWQISLSYIFIVLTAGVVVRDKLYRNFNFSTFCGVFLAIVVAGSIISLWWLDAKSAVEAMESTVYPGQRTTVVGGTMSFPGFLRGFTNIVTLQSVNSPFTNQSEIASFQYLLLPLALLFLIRFMQKTLTAMEISIAIAILLIVGYMFVGVPAGLAKYSLWGRVPEQRADLALGLACILLSGSLLLRKPTVETNLNLIRFLSLILSVAWAYIVYKEIGKLDETILVGLSANLMLALCMAIAALGYFLSTGNFKSFIILSLAFTSSSTLFFNPINVAPTAVDNSVDAKELAGIDHPRILVLENMTPAMYLVASGSAVANGIFYYPQNDLWSRLDPSGLESDIYNRYQHVVYSSGHNLGPKHYGLQTPQPDVVNVRIELDSFDFALSGANLVVAPAADRESLDKNEGLQFVKASDNWVWFSVRK